MNHEIQLIPIAQIRILNPRHRDRRKFEPILQSIKNLGLKKPIQVSRRAVGETGEAGYDLVCGQGRIEAFIALGYQEIPAVVVEVSAADRLLRSLVENIARRHPSPMELIQEIERLKEKGYSQQEIAAKLDVSDSTIKGLIALRRAGEERLLEAVVNGTVPLTVAMDIARADTPEAQRELLTAFETKQLNGVAIRVVKRLMDKRRFLGKQARMEHPAPQPKAPPTAQRLVKAYTRESQRQKELIRKARICETRLVFVVTAFNQLLASDAFVQLLETEGLASMPQYLWSKLNHKLKEVT
jgi:ParB family chromosome partitioning protein